MSDRNLRENSGPFRIVGRPDIDLSAYLVEVNGKQIVDYDKIKTSDPLLYTELLKLEHETNAQNKAELKKLLDEF